MTLYLRKEIQKEKKYRKSTLKFFPLAYGRIIQGVTTAVELQTTEIDKFLKIEGISIWVGASISKTSSCSRGTCSTCIL